MSGKIEQEKGITGENKNLQYLYYFLIFQSLNEEGTDS